MGLNLTDLEFYLKCYNHIVADQEPTEVLLCTPHQVYPRSWFFVFTDIRYWYEAAMKNYWRKSDQIRVILNNMILGVKLYYLPW